MADELDLPHHAGGVDPAALFYIAQFALIAYVFSDITTIFLLY